MRCPQPSVYSSRFSYRLLICLIGLQGLLSNHAQAQRPTLAGLQLQIDQLIIDGRFEQLRVESSIPGQASSLFFGPTDECSIGIDPEGGLTGLIERDPVGFRLLGPNQQGCRLLLGPTDLCTVEIDPLGPPGLLLRDPTCIRVINPVDPGAGKIVWGPTDDCSIGLEPNMSGLVERDPTGFRLLGQDNQGCRLLLGPTDLCTVEIDPLGPTGLLLRDPACVRVINPIDPGAGKILWGPTDDCSIGLEPDMSGLVERDPTGFRLLGQNNQGCRLLLGPTDLCTVEIDPLGPTGLLLRDPACVRVINPIDPGAGKILWGPTDDCSIGLEPDMSGLVERDPTGFRLLGQNSQGCRLLFGPTDLCTVEIDPTGPSGLLLRDPTGIRILNPSANQQPRILFGPTDECSIQQGPEGLIVSDPFGLQIQNPLPQQPAVLSFGDTGQCRISAGPAKSGFGMIFEDPGSFLFTNNAEFLGVVSAFEFFQTSSRRWKENVQPIQDPLEKIGQLEGVSFTWKQSHGGKSDLGFIAEDVAKVVPELVQQEADGTSSGVKYGNMTALAIQGIKAQQEQIRTLNERNAELENEISLLRDQFADLAAQLETLAAERN